MSQFTQSVPNGEVDRLEAAILARATLEIDAAFAPSRLPSPKMLWQPNLEDLPTKELRSVLFYWNKLRGPEAMPNQADFDAIALSGALGYIMLIDVVDGGVDFHYRVYGTWIAQITGYDMTGKRLSDAPVTSILSRFFMAGYRAVVRSGLPLMTLHYTPPDQPVERWTRLILPLTGKTGAVSRLLVGNMPDPSSKRR